MKKWTWSHFLLRLYLAHLDDHFEDQTVAADMQKYWTDTLAQALKAVEHKIQTRHKVGLEWLKARLEVGGVYSLPADLVRFLRSNSLQQDVGEQWDVASMLREMDIVEDGGAAVDGRSDEVFRRGTITMC